MRPARNVLLALAVASGLVLGPSVATSQTAGEAPTLQGLWLTTDFPALTERLGEEINIGLTLQNRNLPPRRVELAVSGLPDGWSAEIEGEGRPVAAAFVQPDESQRLTLKLTPAEGTKPGDYPFTVTGRTNGQTLTLPIALGLAAAEAAEVKLEPKLPALRGTPSSNFDFQINVTNDSPNDQVFNLVAETPAGFQATFKEQYGSQELTSIPVKANESKDVTLSVKLPDNVPAGQYQVAALIGSPTMNATTKLLLDVTGQPNLSLTGTEGRLSGEATAGRERAFKFTLKNDGTSPAREVKLTAGSPSGWKVEFTPESIPVVDPGQEVEVTAAMTPAERAIAGDYMVSLRANGDGASADASFRVTVLTSTMWGIAGLGVIGAAVLVLAIAVARYGRR